MTSTAKPPSLSGALAESFGEGVPKAVRVQCGVGVRADNIAGFIKADRTAGHPRRCHGREAESARLDRAKSC